MTNQMLISGQEERFQRDIYREDSAVAVFAALEHTERAIYLLDQDGFPLR